MSSCKQDSLTNVTDRWHSSLRCPNTGFKIKAKILIASEYPFGIPTNWQKFLIHSNFKEYLSMLCTDKSYFQINTAIHRPFLIILKTSFKVFIIYIMIQMFQILYGPEGTIFHLSGENCRNKGTFVSFIFYDDTFN